jgi:Autoinducer synthase
MGNIIVTLAKTKDEKKQAHQFVRDVYRKKLQVDIDKLRILYPERFECDVLMAFTEDEMKLVGTMSVMYPNAIYPCELMFGLDLKERKLAQKNYVEIGRFAADKSSSESCDAVGALFIGAIEHLQNKQINGWTAIVQSHIFNFLKRLDLPMNLTKQKPNLSENHPLYTYAKDTCVFDVSLADTIPSFQKYENLKHNGLIKIQL